MPDIRSEKKAALSNQAAAWRSCLHPAKNQAAKAVLAELAMFCRAHESTAHANTHVAARLDGRREVWLFLQERLRLDDETLWQLYQLRNRS